MNRDEINKRLKRTSIKGRDYIEVNQRVLAFWEMYPNGALETEKTYDDGKRCDFTARVKLKDGDSWVVVATGHAFELQASGVVNKTSYVENAETSAVGRALGMFGIGITESIASADEVQNAIEQQERMVLEEDLESARQRLWEAIKKWCDPRGKDPQEVAREMKTGKFGEYSETVEAFERLAAQFEGGCHVE